MKPQPRVVSSPGFTLRALFVLIAAVATGRAQTPSPAEEEPITLPAFTVNETKDTGYIGSNSLGASRAAIPVVDMPFSVTVLTREVIDDTASFRLSDVVRLVSGVSEGNMPSSDTFSMNLRGFYPSVTTDGYSSSTEGSEDLSEIARVEVFKGPSSVLLSQGGSSGGVINRVTKSPLEVAQGYIRAEVGQFNSNRVEADSTGPIPGTSGKLLYRIVAMHQDTDEFAENEFKKATVIAPSLTYKPSQDAYITFKFSRYLARQTQNVGQPEDNHVPTPGVIALFPGVPRTRTVSDPRDQQNTARNRYSLNYGFKVSDIYRLSSGLDYFDVDYYRLYSRPNGSPLIAPDGTVSRFGALLLQRNRAGRLYVDNAIDFGKKQWHNTAVIGAEGTQGSTAQSTANYPIAPTNILRPTVIPSNVLVRIPLVPLSDGRGGHAYILDQFKLFNDRIIASGGLTRHWYESGSWNSTLQGYTYRKGQAQTKQYGIIVRPVEGVSLYYSYNENFNPQYVRIGRQQPDGSYVDVGESPPQMTIAKEIGVKVVFLDGKLTGTVDHFDTSLTNRTSYIVNTNPNLYTLLGGGSSKGWEADIFYRVGDNWSLIASGSTFEAVGNDGLPNPYSPKKIFSGLMRYDFRDGPLHGLGVSLGLSYSDRRPVYEGAVSKANLKYFPGRTLTNLGLYYTWRKHYKLQVNVDNLFDKTYIAGAWLPTRVYFGEGRNVKGSLTWTF